MSDLNMAQLRILTDEEWRDFFGRFSDIVLVGNSDAAKPEELRAVFPASTVFVFFNKVYKVLDASFDANCILVSRSGVMGANIVHRREVDTVLEFFRTSKFLGLVNVKADRSETFSPQAAFGAADVRHLDLSSFSHENYPNGKIPTSGYALASWLIQLGLSAKITLAGFSAKRSENWKVFDVHDWTFEQIVLRIRAQRGDIAMLGQSEVSRMTLLVKTLPDIPPAEILAEANNVLADRLDNANTLIDRLMSLTKLQRRVETLLRKLKPKTRKERHLSQKMKKQD